MRGLHAVLQLEDSELETLSAEEKTFVVNISKKVRATYSHKLSRLEGHRALEIAKKEIGPDYEKLGNILNALQPGRMVMGL
jgi:hypothetical protein